MELGAGRSNRLTNVPGWHAAFLGQESKSYEADWHVYWAKLCSLRKQMVAMWTYTKYYFKFSISNSLVGFPYYGELCCSINLVIITEPLHQRGELMPNAGVLLLTKERSEDDEVVRKSSQYYLIPSGKNIVITKQGYGARSPPKAWRSHMQAPENSRLRYPHS
jgi:hypothetical protein